MNAPEYIVIRNWRKFQMYQDRNPPWIKNLTELLHDHNYLGLPGETRSILHGLWLEYASANAQLLLNTRSLSGRLNLRVTRPQLERLVQAGFIELTQTPRLQDIVTSRARGEAEAETQAETEKRKEKDEPKAFNEVRNERPPESFSDDPQPLASVIEQSLAQARLGLVA